MLSARSGALVKWALVLIFLGLAVSFALRHGPLARYRAALSNAGQARIGQELPNVALFKIDGMPASLASYRGHPLFINFFATWCPPCKAELPEIERGYRANQARGLVVLGVDQQESAAQVSAFAKSMGITYALLIDRGQAALLFDLRALPTSIFVDADGVVRAIHIGQMDASVIREDLAKIL